MALNRGNSKMATSYNETTLGQLKDGLGEKLTQRNKPHGTQRSRRRRLQLRNRTCHNYIPGTDKPRAVDPPLGRIRGKMK
jgi:hypothetical protein